MIAAFVSNVNAISAWVLISIVIVTPCIPRFIGIVLRKSNAIRIPGPEFDLMFGNYINTERVECFSDGVFSIVATLLVLDITTENFPKEADIEKDGLGTTVRNLWPSFLLYITTFIVIAFLFFVHHSLFHCIKKMNQVMLFANNISLAFIGYFPFDFFVAVFNKYVERPKKPNADTKLAVQIGSVAIFAASLAQAVVFIVALWKGSSHLEPRANPSISRNSHCYLALKLTIIPVVSLFIYFTTFTDYTVIYIAFHTAVFITSLLFL